MEQKAVVLVILSGIAEFDGAPTDGVDNLFANDTTWKEVMGQIS